MAETVIREVVTDVWTFSRPFTVYSFLKVGGRSTAIKMANGGLWVLASTPLDTPTKAKLEELGPVEYIVSVNAFHHMFLGEFKRAYPNAKLIATAAATERCTDKTLKFDGIWGTDAPDTKYGFEEDIQACYFSGFKNRDVAFFHPASETMIEADLLFNLPCTEQYSKSSSSGVTPIVGRGLGPTTWIHSKLTAARDEDTASMKRDAKTVASWNFSRIIPCHGDVIETGAKQAWSDAYKQYLD